MIILTDFPKKSIVPVETYFPKSLIISFKVSENYLIARIISIVCSLVIIFVCYTFVSSYNYTLIYALRIAAIYFGQFAFIYLFINVKFKRSNILSTILVIFMTLFFFVYQYI